MTRKDMLEKQSKRFNNKLRSLGKSVERITDNEVAQKIMKLSEQTSLIPQSCKFSTQCHQAKVSMFAGYETVSSDIFQIDNGKIRCKHRYQRENPVYQDEFFSQNRQKPEEEEEKERSLHVSKWHKTRDFPRAISTVGNCETVSVLKAIKDSERDTVGTLSNSEDSHQLEAPR